MPYAANELELMARPRITLTVSEDVYEYLSDWAESEERPLANLAAFLLSQAVREAKQNKSPASGITRTKDTGGKGRGKKQDD